MSDPLSFALIGCGRAAGSLAASLMEAGYRLEAVVASSPARAAAALAFLGSGRAAASPAEAAFAAPLTLLGIPDRMLAGVARELAGTLPSQGLRAERALLHLAGAYGAEVLAPARAAGFAVGACHPLVSLSTRSHTPGRFAGISFAIDGDEPATRAAFSLARAVGGLPFAADPAGRVRYHAGASLAANAVVALVDLAAELFGSVGLDRAQATAALIPLVESTLRNLERDGAEVALTGPIRRGDATTLAHHLKALESGTERESYVALARLTLALARRAGLSEEAALKLEIVLGEA